MKSFLSIIFVLLFAFPVFALPVITVPQGGTGATSFTIGNCLKGNGTGALTDGACGGGSLSGGTTGMLTSWTSASTVTATSGPTAAYYTATSTTATSTFAGPLSVTGILSAGSSSPMTANALVVVGSTTFVGTVNHFGTVFCGSGGLYGLGLQGDEWCGNDNTDGGGVQRIVGNVNSGANAWNGLTFNNDKADPSLTHFAGLYYNSSNYSSTFFGTAYSIPSLFLMQNTEGPITLFTGSSTLNISGTQFQQLYISFGTGSTNTTEERMRITARGQIGIGTTTPFWALTVASSSGPQIGLSDGIKSDFTWTERSIANSFYLATSTAIATSTNAAFSINPNGGITIGLRNSLLYTDTNGLIGATTTPTATTFYAGAGSVTSPAFQVGGATGCAGIYLNGAGVLGLTNCVSASSWNGTAYYPNTNDARTLGILTTNRWNNAYINYASTTLTDAGLFIATNAAATSTFAGGLTFNAFQWAGSVFSSFSSAFKSATGVLSSNSSPSYIWTSTTTAWGLGTSTVKLKVLMAAQTLNGIRCVTTGGNVDVDIFDGSTHLKYISGASSTGNYFQFTANNTFAAGDTLSTAVGSSSSAATTATCTYDMTQ